MIHLEHKGRYFAVKHTKPMLVKRGNNYDCKNTTKFVVRKPAAIKMDDFVYALYASTQGQHCGHEYDCCGCSHYMFRVQPINRRQVSVTVFEYRNL